MSYFDDASLVFIPSGTKTSKAYSVKPIDGTGDLTFTRSNDTATRVNSAGLIEKVRTNLILQSQTLTTTWTTYQAVITSNATTAPDGTTTAEKIQQDTGTLNSVAVQQVTVPLGELTLSAYLKAGTTNLGKLGLNTTNWLEAIYDLSNGTIVSVSSGASATIVAAGNGWYRCTITREGTNTTSYVNVGCTPQVGEYCYAWGCQLEAGVATSYIPTTSAAVSVGPVANVPRLDYLNSSCPRLLLEPQRTNLNTFSEQFNNAAYTLSDATITANAVTSPDGYTSADKINETTATAYHIAGNSTTLSASTVYTISFFAKAAERSIARVLLGAGNFATQYAYFNLSTGVTTTNATSASMVDYGNGWYRCIVTATSSSSISGGIMAWFGPSNNMTNAYNTYAGTAGNGIYVWGAQVEAGAYATSYIPTLGAASTRGADAASKTGISSLIGSTAGTIFLDATFNAGSSNADVFQLDGAGTGTFVLFLAAASGNINLYLNTTTTVRTIKTGNNRGQRHKIAISYQSGSLIAYVDGVQTLSTTYTIEPDLADLYVNTNDTGSNKENTILNELLLFKSVLTNAQLAELTSL